MSTATIWLLFFVVVALTLLIAALTKTKFTVQKISIIGIMAALSFVAYEFFRIPNVFGTGSSFHLGNTFTALTAMLLDGVSGGLAGAIGLALADIVAGDPGYAITSFILKFIIGLVCGAVAHKVIHLPHRQQGQVCGRRHGICVQRPAGQRVYRSVRRLFPQPVHLWPACRVCLRRDQDHQRRHAGQLAALHRLRSHPVHRPAPRAGKGASAAEGVNFKPFPLGKGLNKQRHPPFLFTPASAGFLFLLENYVKITKRLPFTVDL